MNVSDKWVEDYATDDRWDAVTRELAEDLRDARSALRQINEYCTEYLSVGGLFNPELMEHEKVGLMVRKIAELSRTTTRETEGESK
jgi:hypothetical protein